MRKIVEKSCKDVYTLYRFLEREITMRQELDCKVEISSRGRLIQHFSFRKRTIFQLFAKSVEREKVHKEKILIVKI